MIELVTSMVFGLTVGLIMCLVLWLNNKLYRTEFLMIVFFSLVSCIVWDFTRDQFADYALISLMMVWTLVRIAMEKWLIYEKLLTFVMSVTIILNYYIYLKFLGMRQSGGEYTNLVYMLVYMFVIALIFFVLWFNKISFFSNTWIREFFYHEDPTVKGHRMIIFSTIMFLAMFIVAGVYFSLRMVSEIENAVFYVGFLFFFSFVFILLCFTMLKFIVEYSILSDFTEQEKEHQKELTAFIKMIREQRHDFNLHLHAINGLLEGEKYEECRAYVAKMVTVSAYINEVLPVYDTTISAMLHAYRADAESMGIHITYEITNNLKKVAPEAYEMNRIIGNLLQNAIDAVSSSKDRDYGIVVKIYESNGSSVIDVSNKFFGDESELSHMFEYNYSGKKNHEGLGLSTVQKITESYKGMAYVEMDEDIIHFIIRLPNDRVKYTKT